jgi:hypothetical protein
MPLSALARVLAGGGVHRRHADDDDGEGDMEAAQGLKGKSSHIIEDAGGYSGTNLLKQFDLKTFTP